MIFKEIVPNASAGNNKTHKLQNGNVATNNRPNASGSMTGVLFENKSEEGNLSIPHIADFYPEG